MYYGMYNKNVKNVQHTVQHSILVAFSSVVIFLDLLEATLGRLAQLGEQRPYKP